jgi:hypothetical protein
LQAGYENRLHNEKELIDMNSKWLSMAFAAVPFFAVNPLSAQPPAQAERVVSFELAPNPKFLDCLKDPYSQEKPSAHVTVIRGNLNDTLHMHLEHIRPGLAFDMFTVERSSLHSDGTSDPNVKTFGMAWYQSDVEANSKGRGEVTIKTILLNQIFGFDPDVNLAPANTFHVGFWFNNPEDAKACGFDTGNPTPFNGEHKAGPLAMISVPDGKTGLGPLCTNPEGSGTALRCNP